MSFTDRAWRRLQHLVQFGTTSTTTNESGPIATVQIQLDAIRTIDGVPIAQHFGFAAALPEGTQVVLLNVTGDAKQGKGMIIASGNGAARPTIMQPGESMIYNQAGDHVYLRNSRTAEIQALTVHLIASTEVIADTPTFQVNGNISTTGAVIATGEVTAGAGTRDSVGLQTHRGHVVTGGAPTPGT